MADQDTLTTVIGDIKKAWGPLTSELIADCSRALEVLLQAGTSEPWLACLHDARPGNEELYRDPALGFVLLAHTEHAGLYRPPHDHGSSWVIYAVQEGEMEMGTYARIEDAGQVRLVKRGSSVLRAGQVAVYLPGDIHDTRCLSDTALQFRFTERDLKSEDSRGRPVTRYVERAGVWTAGAAA